MGLCGTSVSVEASIFWYQDSNSLNSALNPINYFEEIVTPEPVAVVAGDSSSGLISSGLDDIQLFETTLILDREMNTFRFYGGQISIFDIVGMTFDARIEFFDSSGQSVGIFDWDPGGNAGQDVFEVRVVPDQNPTTSSCTANASAGFNKPGSCIPSDAGETGSDTGGSGSATSAGLFHFDWGFVTTEQFSMIEISLLMSASPIIQASIGADTQWLGSAPFEPVSASTVVPVPGALTLMAGALALLGLSQRAVMRRKSHLSA
jgi:hypothetical protein